MNLTYQLTHFYIQSYTVCPTRYRTRQFFNNSTTSWRTAAPYRNN